MRRYALTPSTSLLAVTALADIALCAPELTHQEITAFAADVLARIEAQPPTVVALTPRQVLEMREQIIENCGAWELRRDDDDVPDFLVNRDTGDEQEDDDE